MSGPVKGQKSTNNSALVSNVRTDCPEGTVTEEELLTREIITPDDILRLKKPTTGFLLFKKN